MNTLSKNMNVDNGEKTWLTPPGLMKNLGIFDLDPCCPPNMPWRTAKRMVSLPENGLTVDWNDNRVWLNPPYGRKAVPFLKKMAEHSGGGICLIFARTDTSYWHDYIFPFAYGILFIRGRVNFLSIDGVTKWNAPAPSALVAYSKHDFNILTRCGIKGEIVQIRY